MCSFFLVFAKSIAIISSHRYVHQLQSTGSRLLCIPMAAWSEGAFVRDGGVRGRGGAGEGCRGRTCAGQALRQDHAWDAAYPRQAGECCAVLIFTIKFFCFIYVLVIHMAAVDIVWFLFGLAKLLLLTVYGLGNYVFHRGNFIFIFFGRLFYILLLNLLKLD